MGQRVCPKCGDGAHLIITSINVNAEELIEYIEVSATGKVDYDYNFDEYPDIQTTIETRLIFSCGNCSKIYKGETFDEVANKEMVEAKYPTEREE